jgi:AraC-like DNA-binding protein
MNSQAHLLNVLAESPTFREYQRAFSNATGLPLALRPLETWQPALRKTLKENPFCAIISSQSSTCAGCLQMQADLCRSAAEGPKTMTCPYGFTELAVPVRLGHETIGFLMSGQVFKRKPTAENVKQALRRMESLGMKVDREKAKAAFLETRVVAGTVIESVQRLLAIFAEHLSLVANQLAVQQTSAEPPLVTRVKEFVKAHHEEEITLADAARAAHTSTFYLCKMFKKSTGMCFTEFVSRMRVEKARELLLRPNLRVSEIAYQVGFQSLTHFNRVFKKLVGESPSDFRATLPMAAAA